MRTLTRRRLILGGVVGALAAAPFVITGLRKTTPLPEREHVVTFPALRDPSVVPSGQTNVVNDFITFEPLSLPHNDIQSWSVNAVLSNDRKWIFASYSFGEEHQSQICYAPVDRNGLPESFTGLMTFNQKSAVMDFGSSSFTNRGLGQFSYALNTREGIDGCRNSIFYVPLRHSGKRMECSSDPVLLEKYDYRMEDWNLSGLGIRNHCWGDNQNAFVCLIVRREGFALSRVDCRAGIENRIRHFYPFRSPANEDSIITNGNFHVSRDKRSFRVLEDPFGGPRPDKFDPLTDNFRTVAGSLVTMDWEGSRLLEKPFPVPAFRRKTLITDTHCFFRSNGGQFFMTASLETPQEYYELRFSRDEIALPGSGINYVFNHLLILPSGRHLLCARDVGYSFIDQARALGMPLSELGIIELPFKIG